MRAIAICTECPGIRCCHATVQGVKDISFSNDGRKFLSSSYDKVVKLWDTETGKVLRSFGEGKMFFTARWAHLLSMLLSF